MIATETGVILHVHILAAPGKKWPLAANGRKLNKSWNKARRSAFLLVTSLSSLGYPLMSSDLVSVLIVEDEALIRMSLVDELEYAGFAVLEAATAEEALKALSDNPDIEAVFTDIDMPGSMDGLKLAKIIRQTHPDVAIILTSGYLKIPKNDLPGKVPFVSKPYEIDAVVNHIRELTFR